MSTEAAVRMGRAILRGCGGLLQRDLSTRAVEEVHRHALRCVQRVDPEMTLYVFGSTAVYGFYQQGSDVDFVALSARDREDGRGADASTEVAKGLQSQLLSRVAEVLKQEQPLWSTDVVTRTRVPVLRVKGGAPVEFDITFNRRNGVRNSALLRQYFEQMPHARWLSLAVKQWSKRAGLNSSVETGCLTSYGFNLMVVGFLLQRQHVSFIDPSRCDVATVAPLPPYFPLTLPSSPPSTSASSAAGSSVEPSETDCAVIGDLALDFLRYYSAEFNPDTDVVSLSRPGRTTRAQLDWTRQAEDRARMQGEKTQYRWCIEDPYELNLNVGRFITPFKLMLLKKSLEKAKDTCLLLDIPPKS